MIFCDGPIRHRLFVLLCCCIACTSQEQQTTKEQLNSTQEGPKTEVKKESPSRQTIAIYDRLVDGTMAFRKVELPHPPKDAVRTAIAIFIEQSRLNGDYRNVRLQRIGMINRKANFAFAGPAQFAKKEEKILFRQALDSTIMHHYSSKDFTVYLNGKNW